MKFVEKCFVLDDDVTDLRNKELCAAITYQTIEKHLLQGRIHFSFLIKKNCREVRNIKAPPENVKNECIKPKAAAYSRPNKGSMKSNIVRKGPSIPDVKATGGGVLKKEIVEIESSKSAKSQPPDYSSINKKPNNELHTSPAFCTEALKRNDDEIVSKIWVLYSRVVKDLSLFLLLQIQSGTVRVDRFSHIPSSMCQGYKIQDLKYYRQKYPTSSLCKPIIRKSFN